MAASEVEDAEERLFGIRAVFPMTFAAGGIPGFLGVLELIVGFGIVGAVVALLAKVDREWLHFRR